MSEVNEMDDQPTRAIVIGAGFGGLSMAMRLQSMGFETTVVEALDKLAVGPTSGRSMGTPSTWAPR